MTRIIPFREVNPLQKPLQAILRMLDGRRVEMAESSYNASNITVLEGLRGGPKAPRHVHRLNRRSAAYTTWFMKLLITQLMKHLLGTAPKSMSPYLADGGVEVIDNGRGIPVDIHPVEKKASA